MKRLFFTIIAMLTVSMASAQLLSSEHYIYPLENVARLYSANFGELRPDHFHSGVDIKTDGVQGKRVVAVADGYISRISLSAGGYGLALYVAHTNGTTSVYGHLSRFRDDVAEFVEQERFRLRQNGVNLFCRSGQFPVKQGDLIAYSGNSGSSFGPHLHFEIRESATQRTVNPVVSGIIKPKDTLAPTITALHYIEIDSLMGVAYNAPRRSFDVKPSGGDRYSIWARGEQLEGISVGRKGYFVAECTDRKNGVNNSFGVYALRAYLDNELYFDYQMDGFTFDRTRYCNAISYYPLKINKRGEILRLAQLAGAATEHYRTVKERGVVRTEAEQKRVVKLEVEDDMGNVSTLEFDIMGKPNYSCFTAAPDLEQQVITYNRNFNYSGDGFAVAIARGTLYESIPFSGGESNRKPEGAQEGIALSKTYSVLDGSVPLHKAVSVSIAADIEPRHRNRVGLGFMANGSKHVSFLKGTYRNGSVTAQSRRAGDFFVAIDTIPPKLNLRFKAGENLEGDAYFSCDITDNLSGLKDYSATIDGQWVPLDWKGRAFHYFRLPNEGVEREVVIKAEDVAGNVATLRRKFVR